MNSTFLQAKQGIISSLSTPISASLPLFQTFYQFLLFCYFQPSVMASLVKGSWRALVSRLGGSKGFASTAAPSINMAHDQSHKSRRIKGDYVPVYVALGLIALSLSFGLHTAKQQLMYSPNVMVSKKKREAIAEIDDPDYVANQAHNFLRKSFFRKIAQVQELDKDHVFLSHPNTGHALHSAKHVETLKSVGVDAGNHC